MTENYPDELFEEASKREEENVILAKISDEDLKKVQDALEVAKKGIEEYKPALEQLAKTEKPFYRFFAVEYFGTGEGMSYWLQISRNYEPYNGVDYQLKNFEKFVGNPHYLECFEEKTEEEFMERYGNLIPHYVKVCVERKDQPAFTFQVHTHVNYS